MSCSKPVRLNKDDVKKVYKTAYRNKIPWDKVLPEEFNRWMDIFKNATNCSKELVMSCLIPLTASLCGPNTKVSNKKGSFQASLNTFVFSVCVPTGGKSNTRDRVITPVVNNWNKATGKKLQIENFTIAGLQTHQVDTNGYGFMFSDEGSRILGQIRAHHNKGEPDISVLNKMWGGVGDASCLSAVTRSFEKTSTSLWLGIQPDCLMNELQAFADTDDGFLARFIFWACRPFMAHPDVTDEYHELLRDERMHNFAELMKEVYTHHKEGKVYRLSDDADQVLKNMSIEFYNKMQKKFGSDSEDSDDDFVDSQSQQDMESMSSSKDIFLVLKLAAILHIIYSIALSILSGEPGAIPEVIPKSVLMQAQSLHTVLTKHRYTFLKSLSTVVTHTNRLRVPIPLLNRVCSAICKTKGPASTVRLINKHIYGITSAVLLDEIMAVENMGFGMKHESEGKPNIFFKPHPDTVQEDNKILKLAGFTHEQYVARYYMIDKDFGKNIRDAVIMHHPHNGLVMDMLSQDDSDTDSDKEN